MRITDCENVFGYLGFHEKLNFFGDKRPEKVQRTSAGIEEMDAEVIA